MHSELDPISLSEQRRGNKELYFNQKNFQDSGLSHREIAKRWFECSSHFKGVIDYGQPSKGQ